VLAAHLVSQGDMVAVTLSGRLRRQRQTAEPRADALGGELAVDPRWDEYDTDDILAHHSSSSVRQARTPGNDAPHVSQREFQHVLETALLEWIAADGSGPATESWAAFSARVSAALGALERRLQPGQAAVVCTSGGVLAALCTHLLGVAPETLVSFNRVTVNAGITRVLLGRSGATLLSFNEQGHLLAADGSLVTYR